MGLSTLSGASGALVFDRDGRALPVLCVGNFNFLCT